MQEKSADSSKKNAQLVDRLNDIQTKFSRSKQEFASGLALSYDHVSRALLGTQNPSPEMLVRVCDRYGVNGDWLLTGRGDMLRSEVAEAVVKLEDYEALRDPGVVGSIPIARPFISVIYPLESAWRAPRTKPYNPRFCGQNPYINRTARSRLQGGFVRPA